MIKSILDSHTPTRSLLVKLMPSFGVLKAVLRPLLAKIRTFPPLSPFQPTTAVSLAKVKISESLNNELERLKLNVSLHTPNIL